MNTKRLLTEDQREKLRDCLLDYLPKDQIITRFENAGGDEISSGRLSSPESSAALAANTFGFFLNQPALLILPGSTLLPKIVTKVELECEMRFPWSGGSHAWLDAEIETDEMLIGVESKRYEPFRDKHHVDFSDAYSRDVWGPNMAPFTKMRDNLANGEVVFSYLNAAQLVKHAFGLRTQGNKRKKMPALLYLYAEPKKYPDGSLITGAEIAKHREEVSTFADAVVGSEVRFVSLRYSDLLACWDASTEPRVQKHALQISKLFDC